MSKKKYFVLIVTAMMAITIGLIIHSHMALTCAFVDYLGFVQIQNNIYVSPDTKDSERQQFLSDIAESHKRVAETFGDLQATPVIIAVTRMESLKWYSSNEYASTHFLPGRVYIVIGPKGHSIDIIAHELVHAGIFKKVGYWVRTVSLPTWFDEGMAMQVDYRKKYDQGAEKINRSTLASLRTAGEFFSGDDATLTMHYAISKAEIKDWLDHEGGNGLQSLLEQVKNGADFDVKYDKWRHIRNK